MNRSALISILNQGLASQSCVEACWLEGADALGRVDAWSDIDFCAAVQPGCLGAAECAARESLSALGPLDLDVLYTDEPDMRHFVFHLAGTSEHLLIDLCLYTGRGSDFTAGDAIECPLVLFDRSGAVRLHPYTERLTQIDLPSRRKALYGWLAQSSRVDKHLLRGEFLESFGYYQRFLLMPLVEALRLRYTPLHPDYGWVHISRHLPADVVARLERLLCVSGVDDLTRQARRARAWLAFELADQERLAAGEHRADMALDTRSARE